jgi:uncharacterized protein (DUF305 family)
VLLCSLEKGDDRTVRPILLLVLVALLAACGRGAASPLPAEQPPGVNDADVAFLQAMIPHDQQAVDTARLATGRTRRPEVAKLAASITASHAAEVSRMQAWLTRWSRPVSADAGTNQDPALLPGMLGEGQLEWLQTLTGTRFDLGLLTMMRTHHAGAVELAETELRTGASAEVKALARNVIGTRQPEIRQMQRWQDTWA